MKIFQSSKIFFHSGEGDDRTKIAFVGRPNVGKSSLCNRLLNMERLIVSDVPGTTRETVELDLDYERGGPRKRHGSLGYSIQQV